MLSSVLHDLVTELRHEKTKEVELIIDVDPAIPAVMNSDVAKLKKILRALISNGLKYTKKGGVYVRIVAETQKYGVNLCIEVTDTGIGMSDYELEKVYDSFYQADSSRTRQGGGLGLGLAIASGFVALLGGLLLGPRLHRMVGGDQLSCQRVPVTQRDVPLVSIPAAPQPSARVFHG